MWDGGGRVDSRRGGGEDEYYGEGGNLLEVLDFIGIYPRGNIVL